MARTLTEKGTATRQRIIEGAAAEVRARGVAHTSLDDIRAATGTSKSQLFHYFPDGRAQLLFAVLQHEADLVLTDQEPWIDELTTWPGWQAWRDAVVERYRQQGSACPMSTLQSQLGPDQPEIRALVVDLLDRWQARLAVGIRAMQSAGDVASDLDADRAAAALLVGVQGGVVVMRATGRLDHLEVALDSGIEQLRASTR